MPSRNEVELHNSHKDCWVVIHNKAYNLTEFAKEHPGGSKIIYKFAGKDATNEFSKFHPPDMMDRFLKKEFHLGSTETIQPNSCKTRMEAIPRPPLSSILNTFDFESIAKEVLSPDAWAYYSSGSGDEITLQENHQAFNRIFMKPRVLVNVKKVDTSVELLGTASALPIYITATALGKLGHPEGEVVLTRAAGTRGIIQMIPTLASCSIDEMVAAKLPQQAQWFQLYVNPNRNLTIDIIQKAEKLGVKALVVTIDAPQLGRREKDMRVKFENDAPDVQATESLSRNEGAARAIAHFIDPSLSWDDLKWIKACSNLPLILKGIQCGEDAVLAAQAGIEAIIISNHGGRQLDTSRSAVEVLQEVTQALKHSKLENALEIYIDGGIRRGTDIFKALALGAKAVGLGRPFLYAMSSYGQRGVEHLIVIGLNDRIYCAKSLKLP
ncbi:hypothetical protein HK103_004610 [Boothiomyces macroporosus]|uniref:L-lactate dehydrogenase (cytochrome) n=1 Tax=Boothiomyces macroporosus TaxID=261099 RepID=A0AAD5Y3B5_9FUNG|nr:hypothetical protein HK103_004610 [Boothiomyces macroporosus]